MATNITWIKDEKRTFFFETVIILHHCAFTTVHN